MTYKNTRKQHWIPQFYLRQFVDSNEMLYVYRRESDAYFRTSPDHVCSKRDLYEVEHRLYAGDYEKRLFAQNTIERLLSGAEARIAPYYRDFIYSCDNGITDSKEFSDGKLAVCAFIANLLTRHPLSLSIERGRTTQLTQEWISKNELTEDEIKLLEEFDWCGDYEALVEMAIMATLLFSTDKRVPQRRIYESFAAKRLTIFKAPKFYRFIATSLPIMIIGKDAADYEFDFAYFPISDKYAAYFSDNSLDKIIFENEWSDRWNRWLLANSAFDRRIVHLDYDWTTRWNRWLLLNCASWDVAMSSIGAPLEKAVSEWRVSHVIDRIDAE